MLIKQACRATVGTLAGMGDPCSPSSEMVLMASKTFLVIFFLITFKEACSWRTSLDTLSGRVSESTRPLRKPRYLQIMSLDTVHVPFWKLLAEEIQQVGALLKFYTFHTFANPNKILPILLRYYVDTNWLPHRQCQTLLAWLFSLLVMHQACNPTSFAHHPLKRIWEMSKFGAVPNDLCCEGKRMIVHLGTSSSKLLVMNTRRTYRSRPFSWA